MTEKSIRFYALWRVYKEQGGSVSVEEWIRRESHLSPKQIEALENLNAEVRNVVERIKKTIELVFPSERRNDEIT